MTTPDNHERRTGHTGAGAGRDEPDRRAPGGRRNRREGPSDPERLERPERLEPVGSWWEHVIWISVLVVMAFADAYQFWITLAEIIQRAPELTMVFVGALAVAAVTGAHLLGRLVRSRREGYGGSLFWIAAVTALWLSLGSALAWIRLHHDSYAAGPEASGDLVDAAASNIDELTAMQMASLLLVLYLLTGAVAMSYAYRFGDPRSAEVRRAVRERRRLADEIARLGHQQRLAEAEHAVRAADRERDQQQHEREQGMYDSRVSGLTADAHQRMAQHTRDPQATDALTYDGQRPNSAGGVT